MTCFKNDFFTTTFQNVLKIEIIEIMVFATLKVPVPVPVAIGDSNPVANADLVRRHKKIILKINSKK